MNLVILASARGDSNTLKAIKEFCPFTEYVLIAMSGLMKVFFDRLTELLSTHKAIGKALKAKKTYLISTGSDPELPEGFEVPFRSTSNYFHMDFQKAFYLQIKRL